MNRFEIGDRVRIDLPDVTDPDHERYHGQKGEVVCVLEDDVGLETGDERDNILYRVEFNGSEKKDFRWRDLRPP